MKRAVSQVQNALVGSTSLQLRSVMLLRILQRLRAIILAQAHQQHAATAVNNENNNNNNNDNEQDDDADVDNDAGMGADEEESALLGDDVDVDVDMGGVS